VEFITKSQDAFGLTDDDETGYVVLLIVPKKSSRAEKER